MKRFGLLLMMCATTILWGSQVQADDVNISETLTGSGPAFTIFAEHEDKPEYKGWALVTLYNDSTESWSGINFQIFSVPNGSRIDKVLFIDSPEAYEPTSTPNALMDWTIVDPTSTTGAQMNVLFATPVAPETSCTVKVYTDNTAEKGRFGLSFYPVAVPEPASLALLGIGMTLFAGRRRK